MADFARTGLAQDGQGAGDQQAVDDPGQPGRPPRFTRRPRTDPAVAQVQHELERSYARARDEAAAAEPLRPASEVGRLGGAIVIAVRVIGEQPDRDDALTLAREASKALSGEPVVVLREQLARGASGAAEVRYTVLQAALSPLSKRPTMDEVFARPVHDQKDEHRHVTDIVFGEVSMVIPASTTVSPWLYLIDRAAGGL